MSFLISGNRFIFFLNKINNVTVLNSITSKKITALFMISLFQYHPQQKLFGLINYPWHVSTYNLETSKLTPKWTVGW